MRGDRYSEQGIEPDRKRDRETKEGHAERDDRDQEGNKERERGVELNNIIIG